mmetsp:Transcript_74416/g.215693  ORF Transcript_74416/g.215693 Transcript_74416/m.215693 type:complete len:343 (+) Transcript_74416:1531-2559(+)
MIMSVWLSISTKALTPSCLAISALLSSSTLRFFSAPAAARVQSSVSDTNNLTKAALPLSCLIASRFSRSSARFSKQFAARSLILGFSDPLRRSTTLLIPPPSRTAEWFSGWMDKLASAPNAHATMLAPLSVCSTPRPPYVWSMSNNFFTPPAYKTATRFSSLPARFQMTSTTFSCTSSSSESRRLTILGIACNSRISALFSWFKARFVSAPKTFSCTSVSGELNNDTSFFSPPASRTADLLSSSIANCMSTFAAVCFKHSRAGKLLFLARAEFLSELMWAKLPVGSCDNMLWPDAGLDPTPGSETLSPISTDAEPGGQPRYTVLALPSGVHAPAKTTRRGRV